MLRRQDPVASEAELCCSVHGEEPEETLDDVSARFRLYFSSSVHFRTAHVGKVEVLNHLLIWKQGSDSVLCGVFPLSPASSCWMFLFLFSILHLTDTKTPSAQPHTAIALLFFPFQRLLPRQPAGFLHD